jgi:hypothetical protein
MSAKALNSLMKFKAKVLKELKLFKKERWRACG